MWELSGLLGHRYALQEKIGSGGMGSVFKAHDRLSGNTVAIKRILSRARTAGLAASNEQSAQLALIHEFEILSRLRHPHIIPVLDYGFDENRHPYLVMPYLGQTQTLTEAVEGTDIWTKIRYLVQLLQALEYLHRHGITHRDLKPANVLTDNAGSLVVVDFGLAQQGKQHDCSAAGTLLYLAPEIIFGEKATVQSDLYAVGVTAYQMFTGDYPYDLSSLPQMAANQTVSWKPLPDTVAHLEPFFDSLLALQPTKRPVSARACITMLEYLIGQSLYAETVIIRDSFLHTARFVGRDSEIRTLTHALEATFLGAGTAWLVAGESGVGKSRMLRELRSVAMVRGALVLNGEALAGGDLPYQLWRDVVRHLLLYVSPTDTEASMLSAIVPDITEILGRAIPVHIGDSSTTAELNRLAFVVIELFKRQAQPTLLLLEDLQWAGESIAILRQLLTLHDQLPNLMIVATYRDDEQPSLPTELPGTRVMRLSRLDLGAVTEIATSMLGDPGKQSQVIEFLWQQTEGNPFFLVEIVRALAEESGALANIRHANLPHSIVTANLKQLIQRRLDQLPHRYRPLLDFAAVAGRVLNTHLLASLCGSLNLEMFLTLGANYRVLEVVDGVWRFSHEKLREHLVQQLSPHRSRDLNFQIATALETLHSDDEAYDGILADHWVAGGEPYRALPYTLRAIQRDIGFGNFNTALRRAQRLLDELPQDTPQRTEVIIAAANAHQHLGNFGQAQHDFAMAVHMAAEHAQPHLQADALRGLGVIQWYQGHNDKARACLDASLTLYRQLGHITGIASCLNNLGIVAISADDLNVAKTMLEESLHLYRQAGVDRGVASVLNNLGLISDARKDYVQSCTYYRETLEIFGRLGDRWGKALAYHNLGSAASDASDFTTARAYLQHSIDLKTAIGDRHGLVLSLIMLANVYLKEQSSQPALSMLAQGLALAVQLGAMSLQIDAVASFGVALAQQARDELALSVAAFLRAQTVLEATTHDMAARLNASLNARYGTALEARLNAQAVPTLADIIAQLTKLTV